MFEAVRKMGKIDKLICGFKVNGALNAHSKGLKNHANLNPIFF